ncbi:MAG: HAMP domain-containing sensor histidine kinase, partial [Gaiellaceae bacterium]
MLRRRLTVAFALAVGVSAVALAAGSYFVVRHNLLKDSVTSSAKQAKQNLQIAPRYLPDQAKLLGVYKGIGGFETVLVAGGQPYSGVKVGLRQVPGGLRKLVRDGQLGYERTTVAGTHYLVVGSPSDDSAQLYFFYPEDGLWHELAVLRNILLAGGGLLVLLAALAGAVLAREALRPVARASEAAHSLAEGLLETRLPVEGRDEFGAWAQAFNEMAGALEAKIAALSAAQARERRFTANVAHDLRSPLTALVGEARQLAQQARDLPPEFQRLTGMLVVDVDRLCRLTEHLLEISRLDSGQEPPEYEPVDAVALTRGVLLSHGCSDTVALEAQPVVLSTDPRRLERIVANLV